MAGAVAGLTVRELMLLRWLALGARIQRPSAPTSTVHHVQGPDGRLHLTGVQRRLVQRMVDARRIVWREDLAAYVITETGVELVHRAGRTAA